MLKKIVAAIAALLLPVVAALAQPAPGPGPAPNPWIVNGPTISYNNGGITMPSNVTGGAQGVGTVNVSDGYFVGGVRIGVDTKAPADLASPTNLSPISGNPTIDGVATTNGMRVLLYRQTNPVQNGVYVVATGTWARANDWNSSGSIRKGSSVLVTRGTQNSNRAFIVDTLNPIIPGTTALSFISTQNVFNPAQFGAKCDGVTDDTAAWNAAANALRATGSTVATRHGLLTGAGLGQCITTSPLNWTGFGYQSAVSIDMAGAEIFASFQTRGPVGTFGAITPGTLYGAGTHTNVTLGGGSGTGCNRATVVVSGGQIQSMSLPTYCGLNYAVGDTLTVPALGGTGSGGSVLVATVSGAAAIDMTGSRYVTLQNIRIQGDCTSAALRPNIGIQFGRVRVSTLPSGNEADGHTFNSIMVHGCFSLAHALNVASEGLYWNGSMISERTSGLFYSLINDGTNHFNVYSPFQTVDIEVNTSQSFLGNTFINSDFQVNSSLDARSIWTDSALNHRYINSYAATRNYCMEIAQWGGSGNSGLHVDIECETSGALGMFYLSGSAVGPILYGLNYNGNISTYGGSVFTLASNLVGAACFSCTIDVGYFGTLSPAVTLFADPSKWTASFKYVQLPDAANWTAPATLYSSGLICLGYTATGCQFRSVIIGNRAVIGQPSIQSIGRFEVAGHATDTSALMFWTPFGGLGSSYLFVNPAQTWNWQSSGSVTIMSLTNAGNLSVLGSVTANLATIGSASIISNGRLRVAGHATEVSAVQEFVPLVGGTSFMFVSDTTNIWTWQNPSNQNLMRITPTADMILGLPGTLRGTIGFSGGSGGSGTLTLRGPNVAGSGTITLPIGTTDFSATGGTNQFVAQASAGGAFTVVQPAFSNLSGQATLAQLPTMATNTVLANATSGSAVPTALAVASCSSASSALIWTTNTGFGCNTSISATSIPVTGITGLGTNVLGFLQAALPSAVATWLATPSSANLRGALTDETGGGLAVFNDAPTFVNTVLGANIAFSGWGRHGSVSDPVNITAGDLTIVRMSIGNQSLANYQVRLSSGSSLASSTTTGYGIAVESTVAAGVSASAVSFRSAPTAANALTALTHFAAEGGTLSATTNQYGFAAFSSMTTATNNYGFFGNLAAASNVWNAYMAGTARNYFEGGISANSYLALGLSTTAPTNVTSGDITASRLVLGNLSLASISLRIVRNQTGATDTTGMIIDGAIQSDVTSSHNQYVSWPGQTGTLGILRHFLAVQGTLGTVTNQYGFVVSASMISAVNNYGFYGDIPAAANRWNLYMSGTALNYLAGGLLTGSYAWIGGGATAPTNVTAGDHTVTRLAVGNTTLAAYQVRVTSTIIGNGATTAHGIGVTSSVGSDVTALANMFRSAPTAANTLASLIHFYAETATLSATTTQFGFAAGAGLTGATTNYGFHGAIASGANRWNFYAAGTARNFFEGGVLTNSYVRIGGSTTDPTNTTVGDLTSIRLSVGNSTLSGILFSLTGNLAANGSSDGYGVYLNPTFQSTTTNTANVVYSQPSTTGTFSMTALRHFVALEGTLTGLTLTNQFGFRVDALTTAANNYGFYANIAAASNRWNYYAVGTARNYFEGGFLTNSYVRFGGSTTDPVNVTAGDLTVIRLSIGNQSLANYQIRLSSGSSLTGAGTTGYGIAVESTVASGVSASAVSFRSAPTAANALTSLTHYAAEGGTLTSTTNQYGFAVFASMTTATNNYGFYGNLAAAANVWNIYMAAAARNHMLGALSVGGTTDPGTGGIYSAGAIVGGSTITAVLASTAQTDVVCVNAGTGLFTRQSFATGCTVSGRQFKDLKEQITPERGLAVVLGLESWRYTYKPETDLGSDLHAGFVADQVASVEPELATPKAVKYQEMPPYITAAIRALNAKVDAQTEKVAALQAANDNLRADNDNLKKSIRAVKVATPKRGRK